MPIKPPAVPKIMKKYMPTNIILRKVDREETDEWGQPIYEYKDYDVRAVTYPVAIEDISYLPPGIVKEGDMHIVMLAEYKIDGETIVPDTMDRIIFPHMPEAEFEIRILIDIVHGDEVYARTGYAKRLE